MKSIVVRSALAGLRLPILVLAIVASPALRVLAFVTALPLLLVSSAVAVLFSLERFILRSAWLVVRSTLAAWLRPLIIAFRLLRFSFRVVGWLVRLVVG